jgi:hypothetical protein
VRKVLRTLGVASLQVVQLIDTQFGLLRATMAADAVNCQSLSAIDFGVCGDRQTPGTGLNINLFCLSKFGTIF